MPIGTTVLMLLASQEPAPAAPPAEPARGLRVQEEGAFEGYTLFAPLRSGTVFLVDMQGEVVHEWKTGLPVASIDLLADGRLLACSRLEDNPVFFGGGITGRILELGWDGTVLWDFRLSNEQLCLHHDVEPLPNGNVLAIVWERLTREEAIALGRQPEACDESGFWPDAVLEIEPQRPNGGRIVWEWHARDRLLQDRDPAKPGFAAVADRPGGLDVNADWRPEPPLSAEEQRKNEEREREMRALGYAGDDKPAGEGKRKTSPDWMHTNSVDYHPEADLVLLSSPRLSEVFVIDHSTTSEEARGVRGGRRGRGGELLWRWGNPQKHGAGAEADRRLWAQHDAQWITSGLPGAGHVLLFNNGSKRPAVEHSSIEELAPPFDPEGGFPHEARRPCGPAEPVWRYAAPDPASFFSFFISGCQRLPNGNTLICSGSQGRFFEVTPAGRIVWEYWNPHGGELEVSMGRAAKEPPNFTVDPKAVFRAERIAPGDPRLSGKSLAD